MKHTVFIILLLATIVCAGCKSSKNVQSNVQQQSSTQTQEAIAINAREAVTDQSNENMQIHEDTWIYRREYFPPATGDTLPPVLKSEEWHGIAKKQETNKVAVKEQNNELAIDKKALMTADAAIAAALTEKTGTDSRPVQGIEWLWVVLCFVISIAVLVWLVVKSKNK